MQENQVPRRLIVLTMGGSEMGTAHDNTFVNTAGDTPCSGEEKLSR